MTGDSAAADLRIIAGPTGAGKSALALALAARHGARLISADSRQIYRGFDIGTAKPSAAERARVPHAGLDLADPTERWNAARWASAAAGWLAEDAAAGRPSLIVGGTGLWLRALVQPLADEPPMDPQRRAEVQAELATMATPALRSLVERLDPERAGLGRAQLLRAAEVGLVTGERLSDWHRRGSATPPRPARWLIVDPGPALAARLDARRAAMLDAGWVAEVERLAASVPDGAPAWNACGYREIREVVRGTATLEAALDALRISTRQYAKRQRTWFRNQLAGVGPVTRLDPTAPDAAEAGERWFNEGNT
ncbi:MAG: tRNA (adenosine(37)-N6)-dimethylallyltransferase MiaA [Gemmatimonadaceae bacterium]|nr:tRNA (adenosine(37)-N6)-dimethylallyltransferase MiaA [Gemmatimonadaceae bacterium]MCW5825035.1 tRNA (adenosine(37)-N6)-dimethylallyltransferase MiaA [Gemmatimonadaceae bacterium]